MKQYGIGSPSINLIKSPKDPKVIKSNPKFEILERVTKQKVQQCKLEILKDCASAKLGFGAYLHPNEKQEQNPMTRYEVT